MGPRSNVPKRPRGAYRRLFLVDFASFDRPRGAVSGVFERPRDRSTTSSPKTISPKTSVVCSPVMVPYSTTIGESQQSFHLTSAGRLGPYPLQKAAMTSQHRHHDDGGAFVGMQLTNTRDERIHHYLLGL